MLEKNEAIHNSKIFQVYHCDFTHLAQPTPSAIGCPVLRWAERCPVLPGNSPENCQNLRHGQLQSIDLSIYLSVHCAHECGSFRVLKRYFLHLSTGTPPSPQYINQVSLGAPRQDVLLDVQSWYWPTGHHNLNIHELT